MTLYSSKSKVKITGNCEPWRIWTVYFNLNYCDSASSNWGAATCIYSRMNSQLYELWNAFTGTDGNGALNLYYYDDCVIDIQDYARNLRRYIIWKAI